MSTPNFDVVVFDLDGTLADTSPDIAAALNHALGELGHAPMSVPAVRELVGHGTTALLRGALAAKGACSEQLVEQALPTLLDYYAANICNGTTLYPEVVPCLDALAEEGMRLAICTNKPERLTLRLIKALGWTDRFRSIVCADTLGTRKPHPAPLLEAVARAGGGKAAFVGDSIVDAQTASSAAIPFVAVSFGFADRAPAELGAAAVIDDFSQLIGTLQRLA